MASSTTPSGSHAATTASIRATVDRLRRDSAHVMELRALDVPTTYGRAITVGGWFDNPDALAREAAKLDQRGGQICVTLNALVPALLARAYNRVVERPKATTTDADVIRRLWLPIDIDPVRPSGISASEAEVASAKARALDVEPFVTGHLGETPAIWAFSGNGYHILYPVDLPNDDAATSLIERIIEVTTTKFSDQVVAIDRTVCNAARVWRLYGTTNRKGDNVPAIGRVHRVAKLLGPGFVE